MKSKTIHTSSLLIAAATLLSASVYATHFTLAQDVSELSDPAVASPTDPAVPQFRRQPNDARGLNPPPPLQTGPVVVRRDELTGLPARSDSLMHTNLDWGRKVLNDTVRTNAMILKSDVSDEQKSEARKNIRNAMDAFFQHDMKHRKKEIEAVESRVKKLREQLVKRREAKDEIIDLQLKLIEMEAAGLGLVPHAKSRRLFAEEVLSNQNSADPNLAIPFGKGGDGAAQSAAEPAAAAADDQHSSRD